jgi:ribosome maturation protein SDO1
MPQNINQPCNRISLTNISLVRYRKRKTRFELACYKNKLLEFRSGTETDLDNVLQVPTIFLNVSKGAAAPNAELEKCFGKPYDKAKVIREILDKGEIQVGAGERREERERLEREVLDLVGERLVDPATKRVYTTGIIRKALDMLSQAGGHRPVEGGLGDQLARLNLKKNNNTNNGDDTADPAHGGDGGLSTASIPSGAATPGTDDDDDDEHGHDAATGHPHHRSVVHGRHRPKAAKADLPMWTGVVTTKSAKSQALDAMKALIAWQPIPVMRARMRLRVSCPAALAKSTPKSRALGTELELQQQQVKGTVRDRILAFIEQVDSQDVVGEEWEVVGFVEPGAYKGLGEFVSAETRGRGRVEVLDMAVTHED